MSLPLRDPDRHTYGEYCTWPEDQRCELIDGVAYAMAPARTPTRQHQRLVAELLRAVADAPEDGGCGVNVAPFDVRLPDEADADIATVVQPDISVVCDPSKLDDKGCRGAPDWLIEVLSPAMTRSASSRSTSGTASGSTGWCTRSIAW